MLVKLTFTRTAVNVPCSRLPLLSSKLFHTAILEFSTACCCLQNMYCQQNIRDPLIFSVDSCIDIFESFYYPLYISYKNSTCERIQIPFWIFQPKITYFLPSSQEYFPIYCEHFFAIVWKKAEPRVVWKLLVVRRILNTSFAPRLSNGFVKEEVVG